MELHLEYMLMRLVVDRGELKRKPFLSMNAWISLPLVRLLVWAQDCSEAISVFKLGHRIVICLSLYIKQEHQSRYRNKTR